MGLDRGRCNRLLDADVVRCGGGWDDEHHDPLHPHAHPYDPNPPLVTDGVPFYRVGTQPHRGIPLSSTARHGSDGP